MHILVTRPTEDARATATSLETRGHVAHCVALLRIENLTKVDLEMEGVQALLFTSGNGIRAFASISPRRDVSVMAVGAASAAAARDAGFSNVVSADGDARALAALAAQSCKPDRGRLIHLAGADAAEDLISHLSELGFEAERKVIYAAHAVTNMPGKLKSILGAGAPLDGVLLYSTRTAQIFETLVRQEGLAEACSGLTAYCLSPAIAQTAKSSPFREILAAERPNEAALLGLLD